ncbi:mechanosensitive ion channel family protein [Gelria sp. Kuro-4]|uniref:mechanosensitive ion channel family protein n=1 Tax=Gelria sp. Kuro-4 TaxID=2796927 RepID=UPI001BF0A28D|nr:mechanosensitive ion channel family protein [Gelria sp. Kuro-4]BCV23860.1 mechanosensitive ion channel protein [Gelria sp. Kuro-4]
MNLSPAMASLLAPERLTAFVLGAGRVLFVLLLVLVSVTLALKAGRLLIARALRPPEGKKYPLDPRRAQTLQALLNSILRYSLYFVGALVVLDALGVPTTSVVASAGLVGLAVGFGAQNLVRDVITGFFILFEDQYGIGEYVGVAGVEGIIEDIGLRTTRLRDFNGDLHIIPNGQINLVTNKSRGSRRALVEVGVAYESDLRRVQEILEGISREIAAAMPEIVEGPTVLGVTALGESQVTFQVLARTEPMAEWKVEREMRRRFKLGLDAAGIEIPYPHRVVVLEGKQEGGLRPAR